MGLRLYFGRGLGLVIGVLGILFASAAEAQRFDLDWAVRTGGPERDGTNVIETTPDGSIYTSGTFVGAVDFDPGEGDFFLTAPSAFSASYLRKQDADGNLVYAVSFGSTTGPVSMVTTVADGGDVYLTTVFAGTLDVDPGPGVTQVSCSDNACFYVVRLDALGQFDFVTQIGGSGALVGAVDFGVDSSGNLLLLGQFRGTFDFDPGPGVFELTSQANDSLRRDIFVLKLDAAGNFIYARSIGSVSANLRGAGLVSDSSDAVYVAGTFDGFTTPGITVDFDPGPGISNLVAGGLSSGFVLKLDASGDFVFATANGGLGTDDPRGIAVDSSGAIYTVGLFNSTVDFDPGSGLGIRTTVSNLSDIYIEKLDAAGDFVYVHTIGGPETDVASNCATDAAGNVYVAGQFVESADFDPGPGQRILTGTEGTQSSFLLVLDSDGALISADAFTATGISTGFITSRLALGASGAVILSRAFEGTVDFDPGPGVFELTSDTNPLVPISEFDIYVVSLSPNRKIVSMPASGFVEEGDRVEMRGPLGSNFQWTKDFVNLVDDPPRVMGVNTDVLVIDPAALSDSGVYRVRYDNGLKGVVGSEPFALTVLPVGSLPGAGIWALVVCMGLIGVVGLMVLARGRRRVSS